MVQTCWPGFQERHFLFLRSDPNWEHEAHTKPIQEINQPDKVCSLTVYTVPRVAGEPTVLCHLIQHDLIR